MKNLNIKVINILLTLLLSSCSPEMKLYHSQATIENMSFGTETTFELINSNDNELPFGIIFAEDNQNLKYILVVPRSVRSSKGPTNLSSLNFVHSSTLFKNDIVKLISILEKNISQWDKDFSSDKGNNFEFFVAPKNNYIEENENVITWIPAFHYNYQNISSGSLCVLSLGKNSLKYTYTLRNISQVKELLNKFELALNKL